MRHFEVVINNFDEAFIASILEESVYLMNILNDSTYLIIFLIKC